MFHFKKLYHLLGIVLCFLMLITSSTRVLSDSGLPTPIVVQPSDPLANDSHPTNQIIIKYKDNPTLMAAQPGSDFQMDRLSLAADTSLTYVRPMSGGAQVLQLPERLPVADVQAIASRLMSLPEVEYAEPDLVVYPIMTPNDPGFPDQWHYDAPSAGYYGINAEAAWDVTSGSSGIYVAVLDTGLTTHTEFNGRTVDGYDFVSDSMTANDGDGRDSDPSDPGDWITATESASGYFSGCEVHDSSWHGTHTAGTIGAASNNGIGVTGINWTSKFFMARVLGKCGGVTSDIVDAMRWSAGLAVSGVPANTHPAKVINLSLGGSSSCTTTWQNAINEVVAAGSSVVVAAGNSATNVSSFTPANCNGVITVAATDRYGSHAYYSNYGNLVEVSAPGGDMRSNVFSGILSTYNTGKTTPADQAYAWKEGTSMAAPHVAGVVSLMYSLNPSLTPAQVISILQNTVTPFPSGSSCTTSLCGAGIVNAYTALEGVIGGKTGTQTSITADTPDPSYIGQSVSIHYTVTPISGNGTPTGNVTISDGSQSCVASVAAGQCSITYNTTGIRTLTATYSGDAYFYGSTSAGESHTVTLAPPGAFSKTSPTNGATNLSTAPTLTWAASSNATRYEYCYSTSPDCSNWTNAGSATSVILSNLYNAFTYYWQVRAWNNTAGPTLANDGAEWSFTTVQAPPGTVHLTIDSGQMLASSSLPLDLSAIIAPGGNLGSAVVEITYDPAVVMVESCTPDPANVLDTQSCNPDFASNKIHLEFGVTGGITGTVDLATITFKAIVREGSTDLTLDPITFDNSFGSPNTMILHDGQITILPHTVFTPIIFR